MLIKPDETKAYVANYGDGTIAEISLTTMSLIRTAAVGVHPAALDFDPSGSALWVGGEGYLKKVDLNTLGVVSTVAVGGSVTSLALSNGKDMLVYNIVSNNQSTFSAQQMRLSDQSIVASYAQSSGGGYQAAPSSGSGPVSLLAGATRVSVNYGNSLAITSTPTGFVVMDLVNNQEVLSGTTPSPVRSIATSPAQGIVYLTAPASNALIMVPLPKAPSQP